MGSRLPGSQPTLPETIRPTVTPTAKPRHTPIGEDKARTERHDADVQLHLGNLHCKLPGARGPLMGNEGAAHIPTVQLTTRITRLVPLDQVKTRPKERASRCVTRGKTRDDKTLSAKQMPSPRLLVSTQQAAHAASLGPGTLQACAPPGPSKGP